MAVKKIPIRTCIACKTERAKKELIRIVKNKENVFSVDRHGKASGRGAYVCDNAECMNKIIKNKLLNRAFSMEIPAEVYETIREEFFGKE
jgi:predicted RNA-binding protein YlxR (DUF448 family)